MELTGIPKEIFTSCLQDLQKRWQQCIDFGGNYFEGDRKHWLWGWILYFLQTQSQNFTDKGCSISLLKPLALWTSPGFNVLKLIKLIKTFRIRDWTPSADLRPKQCPILSTKLIVVLILLTLMH
jgi:hypothetical protein